MQTFLDPYYAVFFLGILVIFYSVYHKPQVADFLFYRSLRRTNYVVRSFFIGLFEFSLLNIIGWKLVHFPFKHIGATDSDYVLSTLEVLGAQAGLMVASFQFVISYSEDEYKSGGILKLERNDIFYGYLRLVLAAVYGISLYQDSIITEDGTKLISLLTFLFLIPIVSNLFKTNRFEHLFPRSSKELQKAHDRFHRVFFSLIDLRKITLEKAISEYIEASNKILVLLRWKLAQSNSFQVNDLFALVEKLERFHVDFIYSLQRQRVFVDVDDCLLLSNSFFEENVMLNKVGVIEVVDLKLISIEKKNLKNPKYYLVLMHVEFLAKCTAISLSNGGRYFDLFYNSFVAILKVLSSNSSLNEERVALNNYLHMLAKEIFEKGEARNCAMEVEVISKLINSFVSKYEDLKFHEDIRALKFYQSEIENFS